MCELICICSYCTSIFCDYNRIRVLKPNLNVLYIEMLLAISTVPHIVDLSSEILTYLETKFRFFFGASNSIPSASYSRTEVASLLAA